MRITKAGRLGVLVLGLSMALVGCSANPSPTSSNGAEAKVDTTAIFKMVTAVEPKTLLPNDDGSKARLAVSRAFFDQVVAKTPDFAFDWDRSLVTEIVPVDEKTFKLNVRKGVTFHNGEPLDAKAIAFSINNVHELNMKGFFTSVGDAEVTDEHTVTLHTPQPDNADTLSSLLSEVDVLPPVYYNKVGREAFSKSPVGSGPMKFSKLEPGQLIVGKRNDDYWFGKVSVAGFEARFNPEGAARLANVSSGDAHWTMDFDYSLAGTVSNKAKVMIEDGPAVLFASFNMNNAPTNDVRVRKAVYHAINAERIARDLLGGNAYVQGQFYGQNGTFGRGMEGAIKYDLDEARALIKEAKADNGGTLAPMKLEYQLGRYPAADSIGETIAQNLTDIGLEVKTEGLQQADFVGRFTQLQGALTNMYITVTSNWFPKRDYLMHYGTFMSPQSSIPNCSRANKSDIKPDFAGLNAKWWASSKDAAAQSKIAMDSQDQISAVAACAKPFLNLKKTYAVANNLQGFTSRMDEGLDFFQLKITS